MQSTLAPDWIGNKLELLLASNHDRQAFFLGTVFDISQTEVIHAKES